MSAEKISLRAVKIALFSVLCVLIIGSVCGWMLLNQTAATAQMSRDIKELKMRIEELEIGMQNRLSNKIDSKS